MLTLRVCSFWFDGFFVFDCWRGVCGVGLLYLVVRLDMILWFAEICCCLGTVCLRDMI